MINIKRFAHGFTLVELMVTLAVLGVLVTIGIPNMVKNNRLLSTTNNIIAGIQAARAQAIDKVVPVIFCQNNVPSHADYNTKCAGAGMANGWLIGVDSDVDGTPESVVKARDAYHPTINFTFTGFTSTYIRYTSNGLIEGSLITLPTSIRVCDDRSGETGYDIIINGTGGVSVSPIKPTCT
ncbi:MAG: GspH/FimT family pseudopilin [gamma proteobacterium symbiont of Lucinoma myriamae]|nr:GspH/FimT family pseudopilin [gamma proteobacterium symbiont of Lucinoma myriamae]